MLLESNIPAVRKALNITAVQAIKSMMRLAVLAVCTASYLLLVPTQVLLADCLI